MPELVQIGSPSSPTRTAACPPVQRSHAVLWIQSVTLAWMLIECGASLYAAAAAHSPAMLAFGSDSLVELLSATVVLLQCSSPKIVSEKKAARIAGALLFVLAFIVALTALLSLLLHMRPETSHLGMLVTVAALIAMPILAMLPWRPMLYSQLLVPTWPWSRWPAWRRTQPSIFPGWIRWLPWLQYPSFFMKGDRPGKGTFVAAVEKNE